MADVLGASNDFFPTLADEYGRKAIRNITD